MRQIVTIKHVFGQLYGGARIRQVWERLTPLASPTQRYYLMKDGARHAVEQRFAVAAIQSGRLEAVEDETKEEGITEWKIRPKT